MLRRSLLGLAASLFAIAPHVAFAQKVVKLINQPPGGGALVEFLLTDGTVMMQGNGDSVWYKLTPDNTGSYVNGTWSQLASLPPTYEPLYFASAVLADGRLVISGGEYNFGNLPSPIRVPSTIRSKTIGPR